MRKIEFLRNDIKGFIKNNGKYIFEYVGKKDSGKSKTIYKILNYVKEKLPGPSIEIIRPDLLYTYENMVIEHFYSIVRSFLEKIKSHISEKGILQKITEIQELYETTSIYGYFENALDAQVLIDAFRRTILSVFDQLNENKLPKFIIVLDNAENVFGRHLLISSNKREQALINQWKLFLKEMIELNDTKIQFKFIIISNERIYPLKELDGYIIKNNIEMNSSKTIIHTGNDLLLIEVSKEIKRLIDYLTKCGNILSKHNEIFLKRNTDLDELKKAVSEFVRIKEVKPIISELKKIIKSIGVLIKKIQKDNETKNHFLDIDYILINFHYEEKLLEFYSQLGNGIKKNLKDIILSMMKGMRIKENEVIYSLIEKFFGKTYFTRVIDRIETVTSCYSKKEFSKDNTDMEIIHLEFSFYNWIKSMNKEIEKEQERHKKRLLSEIPEVDENKLEVIKRYYEKKIRINYKNLIKLFCYPVFEYIFSDTGILLQQYGYTNHLMEAIREINDQAVETDFWNSFPLRIKVRLKILDGNSYYYNYPENYLLAMKKYVEALESLNEKSERTEKLICGGKCCVLTKSLILYEIASAIHRMLSRGYHKDLNAADKIELHHTLKRLQNQLKSIYLHFYESKMSNKSDHDMDENLEHQMKQLFKYLINNIPKSSTLRSNEADLVHIQCWQKMIQPIQDNKSPLFMKNAEKYYSHIKYLINYDKKNKSGLNQTLIKETKNNYDSLSSLKKGYDQRINDAVKMIEIIKMDLSKVYRIVIGDNDPNNIKEIQVIKDLLNKKIEGINNTIRFRQLVNRLKYLENQNYSKEPLLVKIQNISRILNGKGILFRIYFFSNLLDTFIYIFIFKQYYSILWLKEGWENPLNKLFFTHFEKFFYYLFLLNKTVKIFFEIKPNIPKKVYVGYFWEFYSRTHGAELIIREIKKFIKSYKKAGAGELQYGRYHYKRIKQIEERFNICIDNMLEGITLLKEKIAANTSDTPVSQKTWQIARLDELKGDIENLKIEFGSIFRKENDKKVLDNIMKNYNQASDHYFRISSHYLYEKVREKIEVIKHKTRGSVIKIE